MRKNYIVIAFLIFGLSAFSQTLRLVKSSKYNYSLKIPETFALRASKNPAIDFSAADGTGASVNINTNPFDFASYTYDQVTKQIIENIIKPQVDYFSITEFTKTKIAGFNAIIMTCDVTAGKQAFTQKVAFIYYKKTSLTITCSSNKKDFSSYKKSFEDIINSLTLKTP